MDDLKERLRDAGYVLVSPGMRKIAHEAAARIEALEADNARLMGLVKEAGGALSPLAYSRLHLDALDEERARATLARIKEQADANPA